MPAVKQNYSNFLNGTRSAFTESDSSVPVLIEDADAPGEGRIQSLSELWNVLKRVESPRVIAAKLRREP